MARKKKPTSKYTPMNSFRYNFSPSAAGHPNYVFGEKNGKYKSFGLTTSPKKEFKHSKLSSNPEPNNKKDSYIQHRVITTNKKYFSEPLLNWNFNLFDLPLVRHLKKTYKKKSRKNKKRR